MDLQVLEKEAWELKNRFLDIIESYRHDLWRYCKMLTGSAWDAEDLVQETLMKAIASLGQIWQPLTPKTYLFRIATNAWINSGRKKMITEELDDYNIPVVETNAFSTLEAIEQLVTYLTPRHSVIILLIDVFSFTARETAEMTQLSEGAVKGILHRARKKLNSHMKGRDQMSEELRRSVDITTLNAFLDAFNSKNPEAIADLIHENAETDITHIGQEYGRETIVKHSISDLFKDPTIVDQVAKLNHLWGRPVITIFHNRDNAEELNDIYFLVTDGYKVTKWKSYYFCKELLNEAAIALSVPLQSQKYMINTW